MTRNVKLFAALSCSIFWASAAMAGGDCAPDCVADCGPRYEVQYQNVERTIYVPQVTMETRTVMVTECRPETRERTVTVYKQVAETKVVQQQRTIYVPEQRSRTETCYISRPVYKDVVHNYTVMIPHQEKVSLTRTVCKPYPVKMQRTVSVDEGHWEEREVAAKPVDCGHCNGCGSYGSGGHCGSCDGCANSVSCDQPVTVTQKFWVPKMVEKIEYCTVMKYTTEEVPYEVMRTVCQPEERSRTVHQYAGCEQEARTREVTYTVCVPKVQTREVPVTTYTAVPMEQKQTCTVMVPYTVEKEVQVPVCRMVAKTIVCKVPVWAPCNGCDSCN